MNMEMGYVSESWSWVIRRRRKWPVPTYPWLYIAVCTEAAKPYSSSSLLLWPTPWLRPRLCVNEWETSRFKQIGGHCLRSNRCQKIQRKDRMSVWDLVLHFCVRRRVGRPKLFQMKLWIQERCRIMKQDGVCNEEAKKGILLSRLQPRLRPLLEARCVFDSQDNLG